MIRLNYSCINVQEKKTNGLFNVHKFMATKISITL